MKYLLCFTILKCDSTWLLPQRSISAGMCSTATATLASDISWKEFLATCKKCCHSTGHCTHHFHQGLLPDCVKQNSYRDPEGPYHPFAHRPVWYDSLGNRIYHPFISVTRNAPYACGYATDFRVNENSEVVLGILFAHAADKDCAILTHAMIARIKIFVVHPLECNYRGCKFALMLKEKGIEDLVSITLWMSVMNSLAPSPALSLPYSSCEAGGLPSNCYLVDRY